MEPCSQVPFVVLLYHCCKFHVDIDFEREKVKVMAMGEGGGYPGDAWLISSMCKNKLCVKL
jgi:hypothetical protein